MKMTSNYTFRFCTFPITSADNELNKYTSQNETCYSKGFHNQPTD